MSLSLRFLSKVVSTCVFALVVFATQSSVYAITNCQTGYKPQTNPFSRWAGCGVADNGIGETSSTANGEWSASFSFGDFITVKGNAYCLNEQYSMPSQRTSCDEYAFPVVENVNTTQTGNVCWCQVTAWQPFTASRDAPFEEVEAKYIQMPVNAVESCTLQSCGDICASIGASNGRSIGLEHTSAGLRAAIYNSVKECVTDANHNPTDCPYGYEYNSTTSQCEAITYTISYELNGGTNNSNNPSSYTIETPTITLLAPTKSGFDFDGWYDENGNKVTEIATNSYGDKTLTAHWKTAETCAEWEHEQDNPFAANFSGCHTAVAPLSVYRGADGNDGDWYANWMNSNINRFSLVKGKAYCLEANYPLVQGTNLCDYPLPIVENVDTTKTGDHCWCKVTQYNTYSDGEMIDLDSSYIQIPYHYTCNLNYCAQMCSSIGAHSADFYAAQFDYIDGYYWDYANLRTSVYRAVKQCVPNKYTITFNTNGGSDIDAATYTYNDLPFELPEPVLANKDFVGWYDGNTKITEITTSNYGDKTLTAHWTEAGACATGEHEQENPLASKWSNCGITGDYSAGSYGADGENGDWYASFDISDFVHTIRGKAYCVEQIPNTPAETPDNKQGICGSYSFAISETIDTARTGNYCWCQVTEYKTDNNTDFKPVQSAYIGLPTAFTNPSCTPKLCAQACATVGDYSSGRRTNFDNLARRDNVGLRAAMYQSVKQCLPDDQLTCDEIGYTLQDNECTPITYTITYKDKDNNLITEFVETSVATTYTIESETITLPTPSAPEGMEFVGWYYNAQFSGDAVEQIATGSTEDKVLYAKFTETETPIVTPESECEPGYYLPQDSDTCAICEENNYCVGGANPIMQPCPTGLVSPTGTISSDNCGKKMLVGENVLYLTQKQQTTPALAVKIDGKVYYAKTTPLSQIEQPAEHFLRTKIDGVEYSIHDNRF